MVFKHSGFEPIWNISFAPKSLKKLIAIYTIKLLKKILKFLIKLWFLKSQNGHVFCQIPMDGGLVTSKRCGGSLRFSLLIHLKTRTTDTSTMEITASLVLMWPLPLSLKNQNFSLLLTSSITPSTHGVFRSSPPCSKIVTTLMCSPSEEEDGESTKFQN